MLTISPELQDGYYDNLEKAGLGKYNLIDSTTQKILERFLNKIPDGAKVLDAGTGSGVEAVQIERLGKKVELLQVKLVSFSFMITIK